MPDNITTELKPDPMCCGWVEASVDPLPRDTPVWARHKVGGAIYINMPGSVARKDVVLWRHVTRDTLHHMPGHLQSTIEAYLDRLDAAASSERQQTGPAAPDYTPADVALKADGPNPLYHLTVPGYEPLAGVLHRAYAQAAAGKGAERHAQGQPFDQQPMQDLIRLYGLGFALGQAAKKAQEAQRLPRDRAVTELLGAINYLAGAVIALERRPEGR